MAGVIVCPLCTKEINALFYMGHVLPCYRQTCDNLKILPLCSCNTCAGVQNHPGDFIGGHKDIGIKRKREDEVKQVIKIKEAKLETEILPEMKTAVSTLSTGKLQG